MKNNEVLLVNQLIEEFKCSYKQQFNDFVRLSNEKDYAFLNDFMKDIELISRFSNKDKIFYIDQKSIKEYGKDYLIYILSENKEFNREFYSYFWSSELNQKEKIIVNKIFNVLYKNTYLLKNSLIDHRKRSSILGLFNISIVNFGNISIGIRIPSLGLQKTKEKIKKEDNILDIISCLNNKIDSQYLKETIDIEIDSEIKSYIKNHKRNFLRRKAFVYEEWLHIPISKDKMNILLNILGWEFLFNYMRKKEYITNNDFLYLLYYCPK